MGVKEGFFKLKIVCLESKSSDRKKAELNSYKGNKKGTKSRAEVAEKAYTFYTG